MTYSVPIKPLTTYSHPKVALSYYFTRIKEGLKGDRLLYQNKVACPPLISLVSWGNAGSRSSLHLTATVHYYNNGISRAASSVKPIAVTPNRTSRMVHVFRASISVRLPIRAKIQKPLSFIQEPTSEPAPMAVAR